MNKCKLVDSGFGEPFFNMNYDKDLFESFSCETPLPVLRFYRWSYPAISLGRFQDAARVLNLKKCKKDNIAVVKRITGGFGMCHLPADLTYSLVFPLSFFGKNSLKESYRRITYFLIKAYRRLGLPADYAKYFKNNKQKIIFKENEKVDFCFSNWQDYDILVKGKKIGGNAQRRKKGVIFQHGSIPFKIFPDLKSYFLKKELEEKSYLPLSEAGVTNLDYFKKVLINSFQKSLGVKLVLNGSEIKKRKIDYAANPG